MRVKSFAIWAALALSAVTGILNAADDGLPVCNPDITATYETRLTGTWAPEISVRAEGAVDEKKFKAFQDALLMEGQRLIKFDLKWAERRSARPEGGWRIERAMRQARVRFFVGGVEEEGPLPVDYENVTQVILLDAHCGVLSRSLNAPRLPPDEIEMITQFLEVEPLPALPRPLPDEGVRFELRQPINFEGRERAVQTVRDHYSRQPFAPARMQGDGGEEPGTLYLRREISIEDEKFKGIPPVRTEKPGEFRLLIGADGLPRWVRGVYTLMMEQQTDMPPELAKPAPEEKPAPARADVKPEKAGSAAAPAAPTGAPEKSPGKLIYTYRFPGEFALQRDRQVATQAEAGTGAQGNKIK